MQEPKDQNGRLGGTSSKEYFEKKLAIEQKFMPKVLAWLSADYAFELVKDVRNDSAYRDKDIDLIMTDGFSSGIPVEVKIRTQFYPDLAIETLSSKEMRTLGYIHKSKASYLAYCYFDNEVLDPRSCFLHLPSLRIWFKAHNTKYAPKLAPNPPENPLYNTEFYPVPLTDIPLHIFVIKITRKKRQL